MSKFNQSTVGINKTVNNEGHVAYRMEDKLKLITEVLTTFFGEDKYYGKTDTDLCETATRVASTDPKFVSNLARYARKVFHLRSVSHVLTCIVAHEVASKPYIRPTVIDVVERADDLLEILACYITMYGKPIPNGLKKALAGNLGKFNEYQISKYAGGNKSVKFKDLLMLTHAKASNEAQNALYKKILDDKLETATRWETELSANGNNKETWEKLLKENKVGYMALLRNLRNIINSGIEADSEVGKMIIAKLTNRDEVLKSKQLPFRFLSAYTQLCDFPVSHLYKDAIEEALEISCENLTRLPGKTVIAIDASGSMGELVSNKSTVTCSKIANLLGIIASKFCDEALVMQFASRYYFLSDNKGFEDNVKIYQNATGKYAGGILHILATLDDPAGGTPMEAPFNYLNLHNIKADRIIILSDSECNSTTPIIQRYANQYRKDVSPDCWIHAIDLQGYGTQQFMGPKTDILAGWSERVIDFISLAEDANKGNVLVDTIENY